MIEQMLENGTREQRMVVARVARQGWEAICDKYGTMTDYAMGAESSHQINDEILRRDQLLFRYVRMYARGE